MSDTPSRNKPRASHSRPRHILELEPSPSDDAMYVCWTEFLDPCIIGRRIASQVVGGICNSCQFITGLNMVQPKFMDHRGKQILYIDFSDCGPQELVARIQESGRLIQSQPAASLLTLTYVRNARFDRKVTQALKEYTRENKPYVRAAAVVGMSGLMQVILNAIIVFTRRRFATFDTLDEAKDWLIRH